MQTELLSVSGMTCGGCTSNVTRALKAVSGVSDVQVSLAAANARGYPSVKSPINR